VTGTVHHVGAAATSSPEATTCLAGAIACGKRGLRVFPVHSVRDGVCTCQPWRDKNGKGPCEHPGKHPRFRNWQERATSDLVAIEEFWWHHKGSNVAIATGAGSGIFVLDIDVRNGGEDSLDTLIVKHGRLPDTLQAITGSGGRHFYFAHPAVPVPNFVGLLPGIDVRGDGGLVVAPPSIHASGRRYDWDGIDGLASEILPAPGWLVDLIFGKLPVGRKTRFELPAEIPEGERNETLHRYACSLRGTGGGLEFAEILNAVSAANESRCNPPLPVGDVRTLVESACKHPKGNGKPHVMNDSTEQSGGAATADDDDKLAICEIADMITADAHLAVDTGGKLYVFDGGVYKPSGESYLKRRVKAILGELNRPEQWTSRKSEEVVKYISVDAPVLWERPPLDKINVMNGLLNLSKRKLEPHSPEFLSPIQLPVNFDPAARCPHWDDFVSTTFPPDAEAIAWEIPAWLATPDTSIQKAVLLNGDGANGKSTYLNAVLAFIGRRNASAVSLHKLENDRFSVARLVGKLANICPDLPSTDLTGTSVFKAITGGDELLAERKFEQSFEFTPYSRLVFSANHLPKSQDASGAFFRRWVVVPFERTFQPGAPGTIPRGELDARLADPSELSGVLNKALLALASIRERGFSECESTRRAMDEFRQTTDPLSVWLDRNTIVHPEGVIPADRLWDEYNRECVAKGRPTISKNALGRAIVQLRPVVEKRQRTINGLLAWCYVGIGMLAKEAQ
jgi:putative DNA primase/helicase